MLFASSFIDNWSNAQTAKPVPSGAKHPKPVATLTSFLVTMRTFLENDFASQQVSYENVIVLACCLNISGTCNTHTTPPEALFCNLCVQSFTLLLHVSAILPRHLQGADTNNLFKTHSTAVGDNNFCRGHPAGLWN